MNWLDITSEDMPKVIKKVKGVCVVPWGSIERHGPHLPLGTDTLIGQAVAERAAAIEPAVVFPAMFLGQIAEARHCSGTVSLDHGLLLTMMRALCDEIGRNGFTRIFILNCHGGNNGLVSYLLMSMLQERKPYVVYTNKGGLLPEDEKKWKTMCTGEDGHAGLTETSALMHLLPESVRLGNIRDARDGRRHGALDNLKGAQNSFWWYADFPTHFAGSTKGATAEKGAFFVDAMARSTAAHIRSIKKDAVTPRLAKAFYSAAEKGGRAGR